MCDCKAVGLPALGETNAEHAKSVSIDCLDIYKCLNERVPFADQGTQLVPCDVHAMEICKAAAALNLFALQLDFPKALVFIEVQVCKVHFVDAPTQRVRRKLCRHNSGRTKQVCYTTACDALAIRPV